MESPTGTKELMRSMEARANGFKQYSDQKKLYTWMLIGSIVLVPLSVYGGFFFGLVDRNFFSGVVGKGVLSLRERLEVCPPGRYLDLFYHYVVPRLLAIYVINILLSGIGRRNTDMLKKQTELAERANEEMKKRNDLQSLVIENLSSLIESRDENTGEHVIRTKSYVGRLAARIMAVADVYDALISDRVYKKAIPKDQALQIIYDEAGTHFDPDIIRILRGIEEKESVQTGKETA